MHHAPIIAVALALAVSGALAEPSHHTKVKFATSWSS
jgi:hypothetical protein